MKHKFIIGVALQSSEIISVVTYRMNVSAAVGTEGNFLFDDIVLSAINVICVLKKINIANVFFNIAF